ncbi:MAG TPA: xanthine dehydrogenase family protein molybdopterin-binding subunit [Actinomycetota bacterium]|nr:xanthine dehydrogenase family protein molybdopterin-binding subunit [Actinomycetota bacterium]
MPADGIGAPVLRTEDRPLVTGGARFVADLPASDALEVVFVRSFVPHGRLHAVDVREAAAMPGVARVMTADEVRGLPPIPLPPRFRIPDGVVRPLLADGRVRFAGEAVAAIAADTLAHALDAAELVAVEVDPIPAVADAAAAAEAGAPALFPGHPNVLDEVTFGTDVTEAFRAAPVTVELDVVHRRLTPAPIETRRLLVDPGDGRLTVWCSHQSPHRLRNNLATVFGLDPADVRVIAPNVGGAFGGKSQTWPEYVVVAHLARTLGRRVRWIEGRSESFTGSSHGRAQRHRVRLAADRDGTFRALDVRIDADLGAYPHTGAPIASNTAWVLSGPYRIPAVSVGVRGIVTNTTPIAAVRGAGRPEAAFSLERAVDELAKEIGVDPVDVRRRNLIPPDAFPYRSPTGATYDSGDYRAALDLACELAGYDDVRAAQRSPSAPAGSTLVGIGIGCYLERSGEAALSAEFGGVAVGPDGRITVTTGSTSQGQGHATAFAQVVASALDLPLHRIDVAQGDTDEVPSGSGTFASRSIQVGGAAVQRAASEVLADARVAAAELLEVEPDDLRYAGGTFSVAGAPAAAVTLEAVATARGRLEAGGTSETPQAFPYGTCVAVVEVDPVTGRVSLRRIVSVDDCGTIVNPMIVEGQVHGSLVQGIGQALYEELAYDAGAEPLTTSLIDYGMPSAAEVPRLVTASTQVPSGSGLGAKGTGEAGSIGAPPAIVNAVADALRDLDTRDLGMPLTPERVWNVLRRQADRGNDRDRQAS